MEPEEGPGEDPAPKAQETWEVDGEDDNEDKVKEGARDATSRPAP